MDAFLVTEVTDSTDFPPENEIPGLRALDAGLRCPICGELYDAPVTLPCGHCFCSSCIRVAINAKEECPTCRKAANEGHLRPNAAIEDVVASWKSSREPILRLVKSRNGNAPSASPSKSGRKRKRTSSAETPQNDQDVVELLASRSPSAGEPENYVQCPACGRPVKMERINAHLDRKCESDVSETQKSQWNKLLNGKGKEKADNDVLDEDPIPKASYDTLKDKQLKRLLEECDLPTTGDRVAWLARHQKWRNIFNSNLDKARKYRRTKSDLQRDMRKWEEERKRGLKKPVSVDDTLAYERRNNGEFAKLVNTARPQSKRQLDSSSPPSAPPKSSSLPTTQHSVITIQDSDNE